MVQMAPEYRLTSMDALKDLEIYLAAVGEKKASALDIPLKYAPMATIEERAPELVGKRYQLYYATIAKEALQSKVSVKETLAWQCMPENWRVLRENFSELASKEGEPFECLEALTEKTRKQVDSFSRKKIAALHPEWIQEALAAKEMQEKNLFLSTKMEKPFEGISDCTALAEALEKQDELVTYTQDQQHYYRFLIKERGAEKEILPYVEAAHMKLLDKLSEKLNGEKLVQAVINAVPQKYKADPFAYRFADFIKKNQADAPMEALAQQFTIEKKKIPSHVLSEVVFQ